MQYFGPINPFLCSFLHKTIKIFIENVYSSILICNFAARLNK